MRDAIEEVLDYKRRWPVVQIPEGKILRFAFFLEGDRMCACAGVSKPRNLLVRKPTKNAMIIADFETARTENLDPREIMNTDRAVFLSPPRQEDGRTIREVELLHCMEINLKRGVVTFIFKPTGISSWFANV